VTEPELREQSMGELLKKLTRETTLLVRQEIDLAKTELAERAVVAGSGAAMFGIGTVLALGAFGAITACFILALALVIPAWAAALVVAIVYGAVAGIMALGGKKQIERAVPPAPQTVETLKENVEWAKTRTRSDGR
jgi:uncharacterized membrane protein YqjE